MTPDNAPPTCDECGDVVTPRRRRDVSGTLIGPGTKTSVVAHTFCVDCHRAVFAAADWRRYPALFERRATWTPELAAWRQADQIAPLLGLTARGFANIWSTRRGDVLGIEFKRRRDAETCRYLYQGVRPDA